MAEEIINIVVQEVVENVTITIQEPTKTSDFINDGSDGIHPFISSSQTINDASSTVKGILKLTNDLGGTADLPTVPGLTNKVDKVAGKGLSTNDYTTAEQTKLSGIQAGATANDTDANLKNRANHTGTQLAATISDFATAVGLLITNKVDKVTGYSLTKNDLTDALKTVYDNAVSSLTTLLATGQRLITSSEITKLSNTSGNNTGDQNLSGLVPYTGASTDVDLNTKNLKVNNVFEGFTSVDASATLITLTVSSTPSYLVTGSGGQTIKLPNATTLQNGAIYDFNNNQSSGAISVNNNSNTLVKSIPSGGYLVLTLIDNSTAAGSWDAHFQAPSNVSWSTNTFDYVGSITGATWNGVSIADNRIASAATWNAKEDSTNKVTTFTGNETSTTKFPAVKAILDYFSATNIKTILGITTLSGSNTGDQDLSGYVPTTRTVNTKPLSANVVLSTADIADSTGKRYQTENQNTFNDATSSIQTQINNKQYTFFSINGSFSMADASTYYLYAVNGGGGNLITSTSGLDFSSTIANTLNRVILFTLNGGGVAGTSENVSLYYRNITSSTSTLIGTFQTNTSTQIKFDFSSIGISIPANTNWCYEIRTPSWTTNPTQTVIRITSFLTQ